MFKIIKESYSAEDAYQAGLKRREENGADCSGIKLLVKTDNYVLSGNKDEDGVYLAIHKSSDAEEARVEVYIDQDYKGKVEKVAVNWSSIGSVSPDIADEYARIISTAAEFARTIEGKDFSTEF